MILFLKNIIMLCLVFGSPVLGLIGGSIFDKGLRSDGNIRNDFPSTVGLAIGCIFSLYFLIYF